MDKRVYWIWLQHVFPAGSVKPRTIFNRYKNLKKFYDGGAPLWSSLSFITSKDLAIMGSFRIDQAEAALEYAERLDQSVITPECEEYPYALWNIPDPPAVLYVRGTMPDINKKLAIAIVGSRKTEDIVLKEAEKIAYELSNSGIIVVSGGAIGVDAASHRGAMKGMSPTVAVLGCGLDFPYLMENELMRQRIVSKGGALVTEYPPGTSVQKGTFQNRNRIISGLARGVVIVSGAKKSGTMITARRATEQNKDIFAVPGNPLDPTSEGPNNLIKDGAPPVMTGYDIVEYYSGEYESANCSKAISAPEIAAVNTTAIEKAVNEDALPQDLSKDSRRIFALLSENPVHISEICDKTGLKPSEVLSCVTELEIFELISTLSGQRYMRKGVL